MEKSSLQVRPVDKGHDYKAFCCGVDRMDNYLQKNAWKENKAFVNRVFCGCLEGSNEVIGFYTLALATFAADAVSKKAADKFRNIPVPTVYLARLAVNERYQGQKVATYLMGDAFEKVLQVANITGCYGMSLEAIDVGTAAFYQKIGFEPFIAGELMMFMPLEVIQSAARKAKP